MLATRTPGTYLAFPREFTVLSDGRRDSILIQEAKFCVRTARRIGLDWGGFGFELIPPAEIAEILSAFPRLNLRRRI